MREQFTVVALPYSCSPDADYHVSLFVSPDIEVDDPRDTLAVTENYPGATGFISFKNSRDPSKPLVVLRITPDTIEFVKTVEPGL